MKAADLPAEGRSLFATTRWARRPRAGWLVVAFAMLLVGCTRPASLYAPVSATAAPIADITVLGADAIVVNGQHVRLIDVAAPQPAPRAHCVAEAAIARQARLRLDALSQGVHHVTITPTGGKDDYDRTEAHVLFDGQDPTSTLIDEGLAVTPGPSRTDWCAPLSDAPAGGMHIALMSMSGN
jgi:hypothetical protein